MVIEVRSTRCSDISKQIGIHFILSNKIKGENEMKKRKKEKEIEINKNRKK